MEDNKDNNIKQILKIIIFKYNKLIKISKNFFIWKNIFKIINNFNNKNLFDY